MPLEIIKGNPKDENNPFAWENVVLNLPSCEDYDPSQPWVSMRKKDGSLATDCFVSVDDGKVLEATQDECNKATRRVASVMNHLGEQDAARKRRGTSQRSCAWVGAVFRADENLIFIATSQEKWEKVQGIVKKWIPRVHLGALLERKEIEPDRDFLV